MKEGAKIPKELQINKAVKIEYFPDGTVKTYDPLVPPGGISVEKKKRFGKFITLFKQR